MRTTTRTIRLRQGSLFAAFLALLLLIVLAGILQGAQSSRAAAPAVAPTTCTSARQWYIGPNGEPYLLPWCGEVPGQASAVYPGRWLRGPKLDVAAAPLPAPTSTSTSSTTSTTSSTSSSSTTAVATGEQAPILSLDQAPRLAGPTLFSADLTWTHAVAPAGRTVHVYAIETRLPGATTFATERSTTALHATVTLTGAGAHGVRVRALYDDGSAGPWSNVLTVITTTA